MSRPGSGSGITSLVARLIDAERWRIAWGISAGLGGLGASLVWRSQPERALAVVLVGCWAWAAHLGAGVPATLSLFLAPIMAVVASILWFQSASDTLASAGDSPDSAVRPSGPTVRSVVWVMAVISVGGVWLAVPDTSVTVVIMASVASLTAVAYWRSASATRPIRLGLMTLVVLGAVIGAAGRPAWMGGIACLGLFPFWGVRSSWLAVLGPHFLIVLVASRVVSRWTAIPALVGSVTLLVVGAGCALVAQRLVGSQR